MNEEWFGICAKGPTNEKGHYQLYPRAAYYVLKDIHKLNPFKDGVSNQIISSHFNETNLMDAALRARGDKAALAANDGGIIKLSNLRAEFTTFNTGGTLLTTPESDDPNTSTYPIS